MEITMNGFVELTLVVSMVVYTVLAVWLIVLCKHLFSGFFVTAAAIAGGYGIYQYAYYIALGILWAVRLAAVLVILAFVLGIYLRKSRCSQTR